MSAGVAFWKNKGQRRSNCGDVAENYSRCSSQMKEAKSLLIYAAVVIRAKYCAKNPIEFTEVY